MESKLEEMGRIDGIIRQAQELLHQAYNRGARDEREKLKPAVEKAYRDGIEEGQKQDAEHTENIIHSHEKCKSVLDAEYKLGFEDGFKKGVQQASFGNPCECCGEYKKGLSDAWAVVRRIESLPKDGGLTNDEIAEVFGRYLSPFCLYREVSAEEAINRLEDWSRRKAEEIKVGDEVTTGFARFVVINETQKTYTGFDKHMTWCEADKNLCKKTGRRFPQICDVRDLMEGEG